MLSLCGGSYVPFEFCIWVHDNNTAEKQHTSDFKLSGESRPCPPRRPLWFTTTRRFRWTLAGAPSPPSRRKLVKSWSCRWADDLHCWGLFCCDGLIGISRARASLTGQFSCIKFACSWGIWHDLRGCGRFSWSKKKRKKLRRFKICVPLVVGLSKASTKGYPDVSGSIKMSLRH